MRLRCAGIAALLGVAVQVDAQTVRGLILSDRGPAIGGALISLVDTSAKVAASVRTDSLGAYRITGVPAGKYRLVARRIGFDSTSRLVVLQPRETMRVELVLRTAIWALETVRIKGQPDSKLTPGREFFRRHQELGKGLFVDGRDMVRSKMSVSVFLGKLEGMLLTGAYLRHDPFSHMLISPPIIPAAEGQVLTSDRRNKCLMGRIDRFSIAGLMMQYGVESIDDLLVAEDVMGAEVYRDVNEVPAEWKGDAVGGRIVYRPPPGNFYMGDAGMPHWTLTRIGMIPGKPPKFPPTEEEKQAEYRRVRQSDPPWAETYFDWSPACGFLQIWTNIAW